MDKTKPFGLVLSKRAQAFRPKSNAAFDSDSDDESPKKKVCVKIPQAKSLSKLTAAVEECEDPSIYEYDSIYDDMKAQEVAKVAKKDDKPSRYIDSLLKAADKRKKEHERRIEKKVQVEREKEGDKFKDKEAFVTPAYMKKVQEMEEQEERERRENRLNDMMDVTKQNDLSGFYRHFLKQSVGEEKIPEFGQKFEVKKEPKSDTEDTENIAKNNTQNDLGPTENIDQDSDIVSSSEEDEPYLKPHKESPKKGQNNDSISSRSLKSLDNNKLGLDKCSRESREKLVQKKLSRNIRKRTDHSSSEPSSESESSGEDNAIPETVQTKSNSANENIEVKNKNAEESEMNREKAKRNIFEKRTIGAVFAEAQARYFQRMAARG